MNVQPIISNQPIAQLLSERLTQLPSNVQRSVSPRQTSSIISSMIPAAAAAASFSPLQPASRNGGSSTSLQQAISTTTTRPQTPRLIQTSLSTQQASGAGETLVPKQTSVRTPRTPRSAIATDIASVSAASGLPLSTRSNGGNNGSVQRQASTRAILVEEPIVEDEEYEDEEQQAEQAPSLVSTIFAPLRANVQPATGSEKMASSVQQKEAESILARVESAGSKTDTRSLPRARTPVEVAVLAQQQQQQQQQQQEPFDQIAQQLQSVVQQQQLANEHDISDILNQLQQEQEQIVYREIPMKQSPHSKPHKWEKQEEKIIMIGNQPYKLRCTRTCKVSDQSQECVTQCNLQPVSKHHEKRDHLNQQQGAKHMPLFFKKQQVKHALLDNKMQNKKEKHASHHNDKKHATACKYQLWTDMIMAYIDQIAIALGAQSAEDQKRVYFAVAHVMNHVLNSCVLGHDIEAYHVLCKYKTMDRHALMTHYDDLVEELKEQLGITHDQASMYAMAFVLNIGSSLKLQELHHLLHLLRSNHVVEFKNYVDELRTRNYKQCHDHVLHGQLSERELERRLCRLSLEQLKTIADFIFVPHLDEASYLVDIRQLLESYRLPRVYLDQSF